MIDPYVPNDKRWSEAMSELPDRCRIEIVVMLLVAACMFACSPGSQPLDQVPATGTSMRDDSDSSGGGTASAAVDAPEDEPDEQATQAAPAVAEDTEQQPPVAANTEPIVPASEDTPPVLEDAAAADSTDTPTAAAEAVQAAVAFTFAGGKPGAMSETVEATRSESGYGIRVVHLAGGRVIEEESAALPEKDFAALWKIVQSQKLQSFVPEEEEGRFYDYGERRLRIVTAIPTASEQRVQEVYWQRSIKNREGVVLLTAKLAELAATHLKQVRLVYIR